MAGAGDVRRISDLAARSEIGDAMDSYGLIETEEIARLLGLPVEQVQRVMLDLDTDMPADDLDDEM